MIASDESFIYATWLKGLYFGNDWFKQIPQDIYFKNYHKVIEHVLAKPTIQVLVACFTDAEDVVLGYSISEKKENQVILHWIFTKAAWRKMGVAKKVCPQNITEVSHLTHLGRALKSKQWKFNPFLV